jgi:hypothetical protein
MTKNPSISRVTRRMRLLAPFFLATALALTVWMVASVWADWEPEAEITLGSEEAGETGSVSSLFEIPTDNVFFDSIITFHPPEWGMATDDEIPDGIQVGELTSTIHLGLINGPCTTELAVPFNLLDATTDTGTEFTDTGDIGNGTWNGYNPVCDGGDERAVCEWPGFLSELFPGLTPRARYYAHTTIPGVTQAVLNFLVWEPGTNLPGHPSFDEEWGYGSLTVLNDPTVPDAPGSISDICVPLISENTIEGEAGGVALRTNPDVGGTYTFRSWSRGAQDNDGDSWENGIDTCPFDANIDGNIRDVAIGLGPDGDGIDSACDTDPAGVCGPGGADDVFAGDCDVDGFSNRGDNCPFDANLDQDDTDSDGEGDACDDDPGSAFGSSERPVAVREVDVDIEAAVVEETATPTATPTPTVGATGTATVIGTATPEGTATSTTVAGEGCAPVIPGTYNGLVRLNGVPAPAGYEVTATIDGTEWGSTIVSGGRYALDVPQKLPASEPCFAGGTITFAIDGGTCEPTEEWASGLHDVDLSCAPAATPPPVTPPPATPTVQPTTPPVTPAKPPSTGGGGLGGDEGLPLWAMILTSWAGLTALAGFGTVATRIIKR